MDATASDMPPDGNYGLEKGFRLGHWLVRPDLNALERRHWGGMGRITARVDLEPRPMQLLLALVRAGGAVVSREQLRRSVWERDYISDEVITVAVRTLRKALGDDAQNPTYIQTFPGKGYRLVCEARPPRKTRILPVALLALGAVALAVAFAVTGSGGGPARISLVDIPADAAALPGPIPNLKGEDRALFVQARYVVRRGHWRQLGPATELLEHLIARYPGEPGLRVTAASAHLRAFQYFGLNQRHLEEAHGLLEGTDAKSGDNTGANTGDHAAALGARAMIRYYRDWDIGGADALFRAALAADDADSLTRRRYARFLAEQQRFAEAREIIAPVYAADPDDAFGGGAAWLLFFEGRFEEAIAKLSDMLASGAEPGNAYLLLARNLEALGLYDEAMEAVLRHYEHRAYDAGFIDILRRTYAEGGHKAVSGYFRDFFIGLRARGIPQSSVLIARYALGAGDRAEAVKRLREAFDARDPAALSISVDPAFRDLQGLQPFDSMVAQIRRAGGG